MLYYLAARYGRIEEMRDRAEDLNALGYFPSCRWIYGDEDQTMAEWTDPTLPDLFDGYRAECATRDVEDIRAADLLICFSDWPRSNPPSRGGHNLEMGVAVGAGKAVYVVGPRENIFYFLPQVTICGSWSELLKVMAGGPPPFLDPGLPKSCAGRPVRGNDDEPGHLAA